jgi:hypothetical protein
MRVIQVFFFIQNFMLNPNLESDLQIKKKNQKAKKKQKSFFFLLKSDQTEFQKEFEYDIRTQKHRITEKKWLRKKKLFRKKFGTKNTQNSHFFPKNLKIQKSEKSELYKKHNWTMVPLCLKNNYGKKNYPAACGERTNSGFSKKPKKRTLSRCRRVKFRF